MSDERLVSNLIAKLSYLSIWMNDIWNALRQKGADMTDKDIALIGDKIRNMSGGGEIDKYLPLCNYNNTKITPIYSVSQTNDPVKVLYRYNYPKVTLTTVEKNIEDSEGEVDV